MFVSKFIILAVEVPEEFVTEISCEKLERKYGQTNRMISRRRLVLSYRIQLVIFNTCIKFQNPSLSGSREKSVTEISWNWSGRSNRRTKGMIIRG